MPDEYKKSVEDLFKEIDGLQEHMVPVSELLKVQSEKSALKVAMKALRKEIEQIRKIKMFNRSDFALAILISFMVGFMFRHLL